MGRASCIAAAPKAVLKLAVPALSLASAFSYYRLCARWAEAKLSSFPFARKKGLRSMSFLRVISFCFPKPSRPALSAGEHELVGLRGVFSAHAAAERIP